MPARCLYLLVSLCVLLFVACGSDEPSSDESGRASSSADSVADTRGIAPGSGPGESDSVTRDVESDEGRTRTVLILGNSITAGYGLDTEEAFPYLLQQRIDSLGWNVEVVNAGLSGETSAGGLRRIDWLLRRPVDVLVLELGGNDGLRGVPVEVTKKNLRAIVDAVRARHREVEIILAGMQLPPNLGGEYTRQFAEIYPELAREADVRLIPFILEDVGTVRSLMQADGIHPTAEGHRIVAENVWMVLEPVLEGMQTAG